MAEQRQPQVREEVWLHIGSINDPQGRVWLLRWFSKGRWHQRQASRVVFDMGETRVIQDGQHPQAWLVFAPARVIWWKDRVRIERLDIAQGVLEVPNVRRTVSH